MVPNASQSAAPGASPKTPREVLSGVPQVPPAPDAGSHTSPEPKRKKNTRRLVGVVLLVIALCLGAGAGYVFFDAQLKYSAQDQVNEELATHAQIADDLSTAPTVDWAGLKAIDPQVCAWVQIPDTIINFPVYQAQDNDYYLNYTAYGEYGVGGQVFLDYENTNPGLVDQQTVIYGHHLQNGGMFAPLADFDDPAVFNSHPTVWYVTEQASYELQPLLCYRTVGTDLNVRLYNFSTEQEFHDYLMWLLEKAQVATKNAEQIIAGTQHVLTMSTCSYEEENGRTILVSVPKSEVAQALSVAAAAESSTSEPAPQDQAAQSQVTQGQESSTSPTVGEVVGQPVGQVASGEAPAAANNASWTQTLAGEPGPEGQAAPARFKTAALNGPPT